jgi:hypothetical protein
MPETDIETPGPVVPNFREDERIVARYESMLARKIKDFYSEHENSIRRNASDKRGELRDELNAGQEELERRKAVADTAREAYRAGYPNNVKKTRLIEPSMMDNMKSLGAATKLYRAAEEAWRAAENAASDIRRLEHNDDQLENELQKAIERAPAVSKDVTESEKWLAEIHAEEDLAEVKAKVDVIVAERADYADRLAAGKVSQDELRLRAWGQEGVKPVLLPLGAMLFYRIDQYGPKAYIIIRDGRKQLWALPYDRRLEPILGDVYDVNRVGKGFELQRSMRPNSQIPMSLLDHFLKSHDDEAVARDAYHEHQTFIKKVRMLSTMSDVNESEAALIQLLADAAAKKA